MLLNLGEEWVSALREPPLLEKCEVRGRKVHHERWNAWPPKQVQWTPTNWCVFEEEEGRGLIGAAYDLTLIGTILSCPHLHAPKYANIWSKSKVKIRSPSSLPASNVIYMYGSDQIEQHLWSSWRNGPLLHMFQIISVESLWKTNVMYLKRSYTHDKQTWIDISNF